MGRQIPSCPVKPHSDGRLESHTFRTYTITVVTPLFGGGPDARQNDLVTPVRVPSIRGQLRHWWRATCGARYPDSTELRQAEGAIWGTTDSPSPVQIRINQVEYRTPEKWAKYNQGPKGWKAIPDPVYPDYPFYALFPFAGKASRNGVIEEPVKAITSASFELALEWPSSFTFSQEVYAALWAWVNFGGLGARTRRGCGSLYCADFSPGASDATPNGIHAWYDRKCNEYGIIRDQVRPWPTLPSKILVLKQGATSTPIQAWSQVIRLYKQFRQDDEVGRNKGQSGRPGRSLWPEADSLRRITGSSLNQHTVSITGSINGFPRAAFGLPIIFHFKDGAKKYKPDQDPADSSVLPKNGNRMASPLVLKALAVGVPDAVQGMSLVLPLCVEPLKEVVVAYSGSQGPGSCIFHADAIRNPHFTQYPKSPLHRRSVHGDAIEAFLAFVREKSFQ